MFKFETTNATRQIQADRKYMDKRSKELSDNKWKQR